MVVITWQNVAMKLVQHATKLVDSWQHIDSILTDCWMNVGTLLAMKLTKCCHYADNKCHTNLDKCWINMVKLGAILPWFWIKVCSLLDFFQNLSNLVHFVYVSWLFYTEFTNIEPISGQQTTNFCHIWSNIYPSYVHQYVNGLSTFCQESVNITST